MDSDENDRKRLKSDLDEMKAKIDNLQSDVTEIKDSLLSVLLILKSLDDKLDNETNDNLNQTVNSLFNNGIIDQSNDTSVKKSKQSLLYDGSTLFVDERRLESAINAGNKAKTSKHCAFISKIFTSACGVRDVYRRSRSGTAPRIKTENCVQKKKFSKHLHEELIDAARFYFGREINKDELDRINKTITDKLQSLNSYLLKLKESPNDIPKNIMSKVTEEDLTNFKDLELFKNNLALFDQLDKEFYEDGNDQQEAVDCILNWIENR